MARERSARTEALRRGGDGTLNPNPIPGWPVELDWASAGLKIDLGKSALDEALPNGQLHRAAEAYRLLRQGAEELAVWLRMQGADV
jgi:hypothetical protein